LSRRKHTTTSEGLETYAGRFQLNRHVFMASLNRGYLNNDDDWLACCPTKPSLEERIFAVSYHAY